MKKTITICDRCGKECSHESIYATVGTQRLPTGEDDDVVEDVDLCTLCLRHHLNHLVQQMTQEQRRLWVTLARTKLEPKR